MSNRSLRTSADDVTSIEIHLLDIVQALAMLYRSLPSPNDAVDHLNGLSNRIHRMTGINKWDLIEAGIRLADGHDLSGEMDYPYAEPRRDLTDIVPRLRELDKDGTTLKLWHELRRRWPKFRELTESVRPATSAAQTQALDPAVTAADNAKPLSDSDREKVLTDSATHIKQAYFAFEYAQTKLGKRLEDQEAYDYLEENGIEDAAGNAGLLSDYELPSFETWRRYLSEARFALGESKHKRRGRARASRSIVKRDEIES